MARKKFTQVYDDFDGKPLEDDSVRVVRFSLDNTHYTMDLSEENANRFREVLEPYRSVAQKDVERNARSGAAARRNSASRAAGSREVRKWAQEQGIEVSERGRLPQSVYEAYEAAH